MQPEILAEILVSTIKASLAPVLERLARLEGIQTAGLERVASLEGVAGELGSVRERLIGLEARAPIPGPRGEAGAPGADGLGLEDLSAAYDGERTLTLALERGAVRKTIPIVLAGLPRYVGVYVHGASYTAGDVVTWSGSTWICQAPTAAKPGEGATPWTLMVKRGRDGRDGRSA